MDRRAFLKVTAGFSSFSLASPLTGTAAVTHLFGCSLPNSSIPTPETSGSARVVFIKTQDRIAGLKKALQLFPLPEVEGKDVFLKPNFNSSHSTPGSTHNDVLKTLVTILQREGAVRITVGDRSGMGDTRRVMEQKNIFTMAKELGFETMAFDQLGNDEWEIRQIQGSHWQRGFPYPIPVLNARVIIQTCCLKTHQYGGHFTLSLKNSVGFVAKQVPGDSHNFMSELHRSPYQRHMIAEINAVYEPDLIVLDGVEAFVEGGPHIGKKVNANVILVGRDRIAIDAVGVALLRYFGTTPEVSRGKIFEQDQIARAVELKLGIDSPEKIELITGDEESRVYANAVSELLLQG